MVPLSAGAPQAERGCAFWEREPGADDDVAPEVPDALDDLRDLSAAYLARGARVP
jgi:hypothetical protein